MRKKIFCALLILTCFIAGCMKYEETTVLVTDDSSNCDPVEVSFSHLAEDSFESSTQAPYLGVCVENIDEQIFEYNENGQLKVLLKKNEIVIADRNGEACGKVSYTLPILTPASDSDISPDAIGKINQYFMNEAESFWNSKGTNELLVKAETYAHNIVHDQPIFSSEVITQIIQCDDDVLSIRQITHWYLGGVVSDLEHGMTFDLHTGERLSVEKYINCNLNEFCTQIVDFMYQKIQDCGLNPITKDNLALWYNPSSLNSYEFFLYEGNLYVPLPSAYSSEADKIICWSIEQQIPVQLFLGHMGTEG